MKLFLVLLAGLMFQFSNLVASPRVAVSEFRDETGHWDGGCKRYQWGPTYMYQLKSALEKELSAKNIRLLERQHIGKIFQDEYKMENLNDKSKQKEKKFLAAEFAVVGSLTELGVCEEESEGGISLGNAVALLGGPHTEIDATGKTMISRAKVIAKVVSVRTGEVVKSFESEARDSDMGAGLNLKVMGIGGYGKHRRNLPYEKVANRALKDLAEQIAEYINSKS